MDFRFSTTPQMFGAVHMICLFTIAAAIAVFVMLVRKKNEDQLIRIIFIMGLIMAAGEVFKQYFCYIYVFERVVNFWFFPWQLCSMAMYCSLAVPFLKGRYQDTVLVFLSSFSLFSAIAALTVPADMMRPQILLFIHGFVYHGLILAESAAAILIQNKRQGRLYSQDEVSMEKGYRNQIINKARSDFMPAAVLFLIMSGVAEVINVVSHLIFHDTHREPNMFYITPYYPTTQPVCAAVAQKLGIFPEVVIYLAAIIAISFIFYICELRQTAHGFA